MSNNYAVPSDDLFQVSGSAMSAISTKNNSGAARGLGTDQSQLDNVSFGKGVHTGSVAAATNDVGHLRWTAGEASGSNNISALVTYGGGQQTRVNEASHGLTVGTVLNFYGIEAWNGIATVVEVITSGAFVVDKPFVADHNTTGYYVAAGTLDYRGTNHYIIRGANVTSLAGAANTSIQKTGALKIQHSAHQTVALRTRLVGTAIRAGYWNPTTGSFTTAPTLSGPTGNVWDIDSDTAGFDDKEDTPTDALPGQLSYSMGGSVIRANYAARTNR